MTPKRVTLADIGASIAGSVPPVSIAAAVPAHHFAFHALTPEQRDAHIAPIRSALDSLAAQTAPLRATLGVFAAQAERFQRSIPAGFGETLRAAAAEAEKAEAVHAAILLATPAHRRPYMRRVLRDMLDPLSLPDALSALSALHDFLTADTFGRLFPQGRAWGLAWILARVVRGENVDPSSLCGVADDTTRLGDAPRRAPSETVPAQRSYRERRERYRRRPAPCLSSRLAAHAPPLRGAHRGGASTHLVRKALATA